MLRTAHGRILLGLLAGATLGALAHAWVPTAVLNALVQYLSQPLGQIFLRLLFMLVIPLVFGALALHQFVVYALPVRLLGGMAPGRFFRGIQAAMLTAFSTASSSATLPTSMQVAEHELRLPRHASRFVLTLGATANQNGSALFEGITVLFLAQSTACRSRASAWCWASTGCSTCVARR
jgi:DAACS family dicarboxylate/amino acid:cation (Na+ or H+) symporter